MFPSSEALVRYGPDEDGMDLFAVVVGIGESGFQMLLLIDEPASAILMLFVEDFIDHFFWYVEPSHDYKDFVHSFMV